MALCNNCGVELDEPMNYCPLCGLSVNHPGVIPEKKSPNKEIGMNRTGYDQLTAKQKNKLAWELSGIIFTSAIIVTFIMDLIINKHLTWSRYTIVIFLILLTHATLIYFLQRRIWILLAGSFLSTALLILLLDITTSFPGWSIGLGIPILSSIYIFASIVLHIHKIFRQKEFNIMAFFFLVLGGINVCVEGIISFYFKQTIHLHWSLIVLVCLIPISSILFFIQYRLKRGIKLTRFFNI
jgi:hypothetical protein